MTTAYQKAKKRVEDIRISQLTNATIQQATIRELKLLVSKINSYYGVSVINKKIIERLEYRDANGRVKSISCLTKPQLIQLIIYVLDLLRTNYPTEDGEWEFEKLSRRIGVYHHRGKFTGEKTLWTVYVGFDNYYDAEKFKNFVLRKKSVFLAGWRKSKHLEQKYEVKCWGMSQQSIDVLLKKEKQREEEELAEKIIACKQAEAQGNYRLMRRLIRELERANYDVNLLQLSF